jgi:hypothetical protein
MKCEILKTRRRWENPESQDSFHHKIKANSNKSKNAILTRNYYYICRKRSSPSSPFWSL